MYYNSKHILFSCFIIVLIFNLEVIAQNVQIASSNGLGIETGGKLVKDENGNIYCFGTFTDTMKLGNNLVVIASGNFDCYIAKFNKYMQPLWIKTIGSIGAEGAGGIDYYDGKLFLGGWYGAQTIINNDTLIYNFNCISPGFIASLDTSGNFIRAKVFTKTSNSISCFVNAIEVNQTGVVIAGSIKGQFDFGNGQTINTILAGTELDIFVARFDTSFLCNLLLKGSSAIGLQYGNDGANSLQIDSLGNMYVAGSFGSVSSLSSATLFFGGLTITANGGYGFSDYFIAKIRPNGLVAWLRGSGGGLPDFVSSLCLENNSRIALAGRYSDNSNIGGIPLTPSPNDYSTFFGVIDSSGIGISAFRISNDVKFLALKKGMDNYLYAADINSIGSAVRFKIYKLQSDTGIIAVDSIIINSTGSYDNGDILPPENGCGELIFNFSFNSKVIFHGDTLLNNNYLQSFYDFCYGKYSLNNNFIASPQINQPITNIFCANADNIQLSVTPLTNASQYHWKITPTNSGNISNAGNIATLNIDSLYNGTIKIICYASNFCNVSATADTLFLTVNAAPIIYSVNDVGLNQIETVLDNQTYFEWFYNNSPMLINNVTNINCIGSGNYSVIANNNNCADTLTNFVSCITTNLSSNQNNYIQVFPNLTSENIIIKSTNKEIKQVYIYDITGKLVHEELIIENKTTLNLASQKKGCYLLKVVSNLDVYFTKLLIE